MCHGGVALAQHVSAFQTSALVGKDNGGASDQHNMVAVVAKSSAWAELESLPDGHLDASPDTKLKWWVRLGNLSASSRAVLGAGVANALLRHRGPFVKHAVCTRADATEAIAELSLHRAGDLRTQTWCSHAPP